jgi:hypothetical protein
VATDATVNLTVAQAIALETANVPVAAPIASQVTISDTAAHLQALTAAQISGLLGIGVSGLNSSDVRVTFNASQTSAIVAASLSVSATGTASVSETFVNNAVIASASNGSGGGSLTLSTNSNGVTVSVGASALSVTAGAETIPLSPYPTESINATGHTNDTFVFTQGFGHDTITGFVATGVAHDLIQFEASMFNYLTSNMSQAQDVAAVLNPSNGSVTTSGGNTTISDAAGDSLTLNSVTVATLTGNPSAFKFV